MPSKIKLRPAGTKLALNIVKPLVLHEVADPKASANAASRQRLIATQPASGTANHARHHVSRQKQA
ncbi:MAG: hypothetical protein NTV51_03400 [Verrucomicrobia bacterium]|nr:hypothetical protein [Verrucomicrobiota bacterium]